MKKTVLLYVALALSLLCNIVLTVRLAEHGRSHAKPGSVAGPSVGTRVPALELETETGERLRLSFPRERPVVLYAVRSECSWCTRNFPAFSEVAGAAADTFDVLVIDIGRDPLSVSERSRYRESTPAIAGLRGPFRVDTGTLGWRFDGTPHTVVIGNDGTVTESWLGAYVRGRATEISEFFGVVVIDPSQVRD